MSSSTTIQPPLGPHEQALAQYRTISRTALVALGLGIASALVLASPLLSLIPLLAIAAALIGLRVIRTSGNRLIGRVPAVLGLCLATFFLGWGISQRFSREMTLERHARQFAEDWLTLVAQGELQQAHQLHASAHIRVRSAAARQEYYVRNPEALTDLNNFFAKPAIKDFVAQGQGVQYQFDSPAGGERNGAQDLVVLKFTYRTTDGTTRPLWITVKREVHVDHTDWVIDKTAGEAESSS